MTLDNLAISTRFSSAAWLLCLLLRYHSCMALHSADERSVLDAIARAGVVRFSVLELAGSRAGGVGNELARRFPQATVVSLKAKSTPSAPNSRVGSARPANHYPISCSATEQIRHVRRLFDSPTIFTFIVVLDDYLTSNEAVADEGLLIGVARQAFLSVTDASSEDWRSRVAESAKKLGVTVAHFLPLGRHVVQVVNGGFERDVRHHFGDIRKCPRRGYRFMYSHPPVTGDPGAVGLTTHPQLQRLRYGISRSSLKKGAVATDAFGCAYTNQLEGATLSQPSWVNLFTLSGLGLPSGSDSALQNQILTGVLALPHFSDGVPWNACLEGSKVVWCDMDFGEQSGPEPIRESALRGTCEGGMDWQQDKTPPCILDMMLIATTGCDNQAGFFQLRDAWFGGSGNNGHNPKARPLPSNVMQDCKAKW
eukprot:CAMPEP_0177786858 /NCGR_PEP_ID=MMETSP0491_2-20121128/21158_1 /TAXON_ID=63592 /ORGANISM="Tetraselmis chuii, Strain PLY429" /LENGTH=422 /DNA_ID=CAMNT_0019308119 /DNA_START=270 /DNA_END=1535 /DNA_ORIENTATION=-